MKKYLIGRISRRVAAKTVASLIVLVTVALPASPVSAAERVQLGFFQTLGDSAVELFIDDVSAGIAGPSEGILVDVEEGKHTVSVRSVDDDTATEEIDTIDLETEIRFDVGKPQLLVAHLNEAGDEPLLSLADAPIPSSTNPQCVSVFHSASAPAVDVFVDEILVRRNLKNGQLSPKLAVEGFNTTVSLTPSGSGVVAAGPLDFEIGGNTCEIVAVTGDPTSSFNVQKVLTFSLLPENAWGDLLGMSELVLLNATEEAVKSNGSGLDAATLEPLGGVASMPVDAGRYSVGFESDSGDEPVEGTASALGGASVTMAVHYDAEQTLRTSAFVDDGQRLPVGRACVDVRHTAGAPAIDIYVDDTPISEAIESGQSTGRSQVKPGSRTVVLTPVGSSTPVVEPIGVSVREGQCVLVHLIGSVEVPDSLRVVVLELNGIQSVPNAVPSGNSPLPQGPGRPIGLLAFGALGVVGAVVGVVVRRRPIGRRFLSVSNSG